MFYVTTTITKCEWCSRSAFYELPRCMWRCCFQESIREWDIDEFIMGMASQIAEREDNTITPDLRGTASKQGKSATMYILSGTFMNLFSVAPKRKRERKKE